MILAGMAVASFTAAAFRASSVLTGSVTKAAGGWITVEQ
jgi:hypothetical protein